MIKQQTIQEFVKSKGLTWAQWLDLSFAERLALRGWLGPFTFRPFSRKEEGR